jgi:hypothetical protein
MHPCHLAGIDEKCINPNDYINSLRMEGSPAILQEPQYQQYKIASIAYESDLIHCPLLMKYLKCMGKTRLNFAREMLKETRKQRVCNGLSDR